MQTRFTTLSSAHGLKPERVIADMAAVLDSARRVAGEIEFDSLIELIVERAAAIARAERASLFLIDEKAGVLRTRVALGASEIVVPLGQGIVGNVASSRTASIVPDARADPRFHAASDRKSGFITISVLSVPLIASSNRVVGVLQLLNKKVDEQHAAFNEYDCELMEAFAGLVAVVLDKATLVVEQIQRQRLEGALALAREIQEHFLPGAAPPHPRLEIAGRSVPAESAGGDYFDCIRLAGGEVLFVVGDATGHGVGPALLMATARATMQTLARTISDPAVLLAGVNRQLAGDTGGSRFMSMVVAVIDPDGHSMTYACAGHRPPMVLRNGACLVLPLGGMPAGLFDGADYQKHGPIALDPGDLVFSCTDGLWEGENPEGDRLGIDRLLEVLQEHRQGPADLTLDAIFNAFTIHARGRPADDDLTAMIVRVKQDAR